MAKLLRSSAVAYARRGDHTIGPGIVPPSSKSTVSVSIADDTRTALVGVSVTSTEFVPLSAQQFEILPGDTLHLTQFLSPVPGFSAIRTSGSSHSLELSFQGAVIL